MANMNSQSDSSVLKSTSSEKGHDPDLEEAVTKTDRTAHSVTWPDRKMETQSRIKAFLRAIVHFDYTNSNLLPAIRTAIIMVVAWLLMRTNAAYSAAFQMGCLLPGSADPNGSLGLRLHVIGAGGLSISLIGVLLPCIVWESTAAVVILAVVLAVATGYAGRFASPVITMAMKMGCLNFAVMCGMNASMGGYDNVWAPFLYCLCGAGVNCFFSILPEIIGNREAMRSQMFRFWFGFGKNLCRWSADWGTEAHYMATLTPVVTVSLTKTRGMIENNPGETEEAKEWQRRIMDRADTIRMVFHCLSTTYQLTEDHYVANGIMDWVPLKKDNIHELVGSVGSLCQEMAFHLLFPWITRYIPFIRDRLKTREAQVLKAAQKLKEHPTDGLRWLPAIIELLEDTVKDIVNIVQDGSNWPAYSPLHTLPKRFAAAFPKDFFKKQESQDGTIIHFFAIRFGVTFGLAMMILAFVDSSKSPYWFPLSVGILSFPSESATYQRVAQRTLGTIVGISWGAALSPLTKEYPGAFTIFLAINSFMLVGVFHASYIMCVIFITGWVFTTNSSLGFPLVSLVEYRLLWTVAAVVLVMLAVFLFPVKSEYKVTRSIVTMAKTTEEYAQAVANHQNLVRDSLVEEVNQESVKSSLDELVPLQKALQTARVSMTRIISDAVLIPTEGVVVDPHTLAPALESSLIGASAILHLTLFVPLECAEDLLVDIDEASIAEVDRLVRRLEEYTSVPTEWTTQGTEASDDDDRESIHITQPGRGPFSHAISLSHRRLDLLGVPPDAIKEQHS